jgi:sugar lactone lactonase YvrE
MLLIFKRIFKRSIFPYGLSWIAMFASWLVFGVLGGNAQEPPLITLQPLNQSVLEGQVAMLHVKVSGTGPFSYQWQCNGTNVSNAFITTVAGNGRYGFAGDGGLAVNAWLRAPNGVTIDAGQNLLICDHYNSAIRRVGTDGVISTVAGSPPGGGYSGDGGAATSATLNLPDAVAVDAVGGFYIADFYNEVIRRIDARGTITTVAGTGGHGYKGDGGAATNATFSDPFGLALDAAGNLFISDTHNNAIRMVNTSGIITTVAGRYSLLGGYTGDGGPATLADLRRPYGVVVDAAGNLYVADQGNSAIRRIDASGIITTVARGIGSPYGLALNASGELFAADVADGLVIKLDVTGTASTVASGLASPAGIALDAVGNLYIADSGNNRIQEVHFGGLPDLRIASAAATNTGNYRVIVGNKYGSSTSAVVSVTVLPLPVIITPPATVAVAYGGTARLSVVAGGTPPLTYAWYARGANPVPGGTNATLVLPNVGAADAGSYRVVVTDLYGSVTSQAANLLVGYPPSIVSQPVGLLASAGAPFSLSVEAAGTGPFTYQWQVNGTNLPNGTIETVAGSDSKGFSGDGGEATQAGLNAPYDVAIDSAGSLYIADTGNVRIRKVDTRGLITTLTGPTHMVDPRGIAVNVAGSVFIAAPLLNRIVALDGNGNFTTYAGIGSQGPINGDGPATGCYLASPRGVAVDGSGNVILSDTGNQRVCLVDTNGNLHSIAFNLSMPTGVAADGAGHYYVVDSGVNLVRRIDSTGTTTVAGNGSYGYSGDGGLATNASLSFPTGVAVDLAGRLYIADSGNNRIRRVDSLGIITTVAGDGNARYTGDGGMATAASLNNPTRVALDNSGYLFVADSGNNRIRRTGLSFGQGRTLALNNATTNSIGDYQVIVGSPFGVVTSAVAHVSVTLPVLKAALSVRQLNILFSGVPGADYILETSSSLKSPIIWCSIFTNAADDRGNWTFALPISATITNRYFRLSPQ